MIMWKAMRRQNPKIRIVRGMVVNTHMERVPPRVKERCTLY